MLDTKAYAVVGRPKSGKTFWTKRAVIALQRPALVWDINAEWGQDAPPEHEFVKRATALRRGVVVWEEATTFLDSPNSKVSRQAAALISRRRHSENTHFLLFTSLRQVPTRIMDNLNRVILFPTGDNPALMQQKFKMWPEILAALEKQQREPLRDAGGYFVPIDVHIFGA